MKKKGLCVKCKEDMQYTSNLCRKCYKKELRKGVENRIKEDI